jgi:uncharacterized membrane protein
MAEVRDSISINRSITSVFQLAADTDQLDQWQPDVTASHYSDKKLRVGVMITQDRKTYALGWKLDLNADIIEYVPNRTISYKGVLGRFPVLGTIEFESSGGATTVTETIDIKIGILHILFSPLIRGAVSKRTRQSLQALKILAEKQG